LGAPDHPIARGADDVDLNGGDHMQVAPGARGANGRTRQYRRLASTPANFRKDFSRIKFMD